MLLMLKYVKEFMNSSGPLEHLAAFAVVAVVTAGVKKYFSELSKREVD
jgi:hypothetical protein